MTKWDLFQVCKAGPTLRNQLVRPNLSTGQKKDPIVTSIDTEKAFENIPITINILSKLELQGNFLNLVKRTYKKPIANIFLSRERLNVFPPKTENKARIATLTILSERGFGIPSHCNQARKRNIQHTN